MASVNLKKNTLRAQVLKVVYIICRGNLIYLYQKTVLYCYRLLYYEQGLLVTVNSCLIYSI